MDETQQKMSSDSRVCTPHMSTNRRRTPPVRVKRFGTTKRQLSNLYKRLCFICACLRRRVHRKYAGEIEMQHDCATTTNQSNYYICLRFHDLLFGHFALLCFFVFFFVDGIADSISETLVLALPVCDIRFSSFRIRTNIFIVRAYARHNPKAVEYFVRYTKMALIEHLLSFSILLSN